MLTLLRGVCLSLIVWAVPHCAAQAQCYYDAGCYHPCYQQQPRERFPILRRLADGVSGLFAGQVNPPVDVTGTIGYVTIDPGFFTGQTSASFDPVEGLGPDHAIYYPEYNEAPPLWGDTEALESEVNPQPLRGSLPQEDETVLIPPEPAWEPRKRGWRPKRQDLGKWSATNALRQ